PGPKPGASANFATPAWNLSIRLLIRQTDGANVRQASRSSFVPRQRTEGIVVSMKNAAGTALVPTLSRIVLGLAFTFAGYQKVMVDQTFTASEAATLQTYDVTMTPKTADASTEDTASAAASTITRASLRLVMQDADPPVQGDTSDSTGVKDPGPYPELPSETPPVKPAASETPTATEAGQTPTKDVEKPGTSNAPTAPVVTPPSAGTTPPDATGTAAETPATPIALDPDAEYTARGLHKITLMCDSLGWKYADKLAWAAALTELIGGGLLLLGLFSRLCALGLASTMGVAFYMTSWGILTDGGGFRLFDAAISEHFAMIYLQLAFFVMSFGIIFTGPGPLSLDRILFGRSSSSKEDLD
ncbi:MAG: DoxX family membrane protein, partial [Phycisphaerales bacterium]|nr:DoxX family membrane protein [Phycisphaerales bacterium]